MPLSCSLPNCSYVTEDVAENLMVELLRIHTTAWHNHKLSRHSHLNNMYKSRNNIKNPFSRLLRAITTLFPTTSKMMPGRTSLGSTSTRGTASTPALTSRT